jgi:hypothetical protein
VRNYATILNLKIKTKTKMKTLDLMDVTILNLNKASVSVSYKGDTILITRRLFNKLLREGELEGDVVIKKFINNAGNEVSTKWFAALSIF